MKTGTHIKALMKKNLILWKRSCCCSCLEIFIPIIMLSLLYIVRSGITETKFPETSYISQSIFLPSQIVNDQGQVTKAFIKNCINSSRSEFPIYRNGKIALSPQNKFTNSLEQQFNLFGYQALYFQNKQEIQEYVSSSFYENNICLGVTFEKSGEDQQYHYSLLFNTSAANNNNGEVPPTILEETNNYRVEMKNEYFNPWFQSGFLTIQNLIDNLILKAETGSTQSSISPNIMPIKVQEHIRDDMASIMKGNLAAYTVLPLLIVFLRMSYQLLVEKEKKIREGMKIMGMSDTSFYISWILHYLAIYTIISLLASAILVSSLFKHSNYLLIFFWYWLFCVSLIFQSIFITVFFTRAKIGNIVAMVFYLLNYQIVFFLQEPDVPLSVKALSSLSSQTAMSQALDQFIVVESEQKGISWSNASETIENYSVGISIAFIIINILIFSSLGIYLDQVIPNEWGKKKHPLFCCKSLLSLCKSNESNSKQNNVNTSLNEELVNPSNYNNKLENKQQYDHNIEQVSAGLKQLEQANKVVQLKNVYKTYPSGKQAVKDLSLTMYNSQVFVLLGHNGAGKTTTISMLTGLLEFSEGSAKAFGYDVSNQIQDIRQFMGVCPQHNILFDSLTVQEHLELFAAFKGMDPAEIPAAAARMLQDIDLVSKKDDYSSNLSGGQKRKLSVAIAFIGGSKLIYLDEPTSGMDTSARRHLWEMIKKYKNEKIVVLTTHFMDEADYLGDRIAIMGEGKLICCGSSVFLKNKYGVGYNLTIVKRDTQADSQIIINFVKGYVQDANVLSNVSAEISFQLPMETVKQFPILFDQIDQNKQKLGIQSYGISITTLEEVFLKVTEVGSENMSVPNPIALINKNKNNQKDDIDDFDLNSVRVQGAAQIFCIHFWCLILKRLLYFKRDFRGMICEIFLPCFIVIIGLAISSIDFTKDLPEQIISPTMLPTPLNIIYSGSVPTNDQNSLFTYFSSNYWTASVYPDAKDLYNWDQVNFLARSKSRKGSYFITQTISSSSGPFNYAYQAQVNTISKDTAPLFINQMNQAMIRQATNKPQLSIQVTNAPFRYTKQIKNFDSVVDGLIATFIFSIGLAFIPASIVTFIVKEREDNVKHSQIVSGVSLKAYWFSNFSLDIIKHMIPALFCIGMIKAFNVTAFNEGTNFTCASLLLVLYGWAIIPFCYVLGFLFQSYGNAQVANFFLHFIFGAILTVAVFIFRIIKSTKEIGKALQWVFRFIPSFSFGTGVLNIGSRQLYAILAGEKQLRDAFDFEIAGGDVIFLVCEGFFYYGLVFLIEYLAKMRSVSSFITKENTVQYTQKPYDDDVQREMDMVASAQPSDYTVLVRDLRKVYKLPSSQGYKVGVDRVSFSIKNGECFTLLGVNGAGKTSTFKVLSGEILPSSGEAFIAGYNLSTQMSEARRHIGYCPQFDALLENLTAREHLELYASIKGLPKEQRDILIDKKLQEMDLAKFEGVLAGSFSGGNKRKLSVAIAMLGNPPIVFLDEPSTGMDPEARRFMWNVISRISTQRKRSSIILTTHSMEEAEALSTKIAIMVSGELKCLGSVQHIKNKFGRGYEIEIKTTLPTQGEITHRLANSAQFAQRIKFNDLSSVLQKFNAQWIFDSISENGFGSAIYLQLKSEEGLLISTLVEYICLEEKGQEIMRFIQTSLGAFTLIEHFQALYRFKIETNISIGHLFRIFEENKDHLSIAQYSVKQATIEQIFNLFAEGKFDPIQIRRKSSYHSQRLLDNQQIQMNPNEKSRFNQDNNNAMSQTQQNYNLNNSGQVNGKLDWFQSPNEPQMSVQNLLNKNENNNNINNMKNDISIEMQETQINNKERKIW